MRTDSVLIIAAEKNNFFESLLNNFSFGRVVHAENFVQAESFLEDEDFSLILIDSVGLKASVAATISFSQKMFSAITYFTKEDNETEQKILEENGVFVISSRDSSQLILRVINLQLSTLHRTLNLEKEKAQLQSSFEEEKLVNRAKCILIQYLNMTETQAHKYIEKQSMNLRQSRLLTAESILKTYER